MHQSPPSSRGDDEMDPRVRLGEALTAIKDEERQWIVRVVAVLSQKSSTTVALHRNQEKGRLGWVMLEPASPTCAQIAQPIEDHYSIVGVHVSARSSPGGELRDATDDIDLDVLEGVVESFR